MQHVTRALFDWLSQNNIETEGVRIVVEFPNEHLARIAEACIQREIEPMLRYYNEKFGQVDTMNGIGLSLRVSK
jgi:hypothetical protein